MPSISHDSFLMGLLQRPHDAGPVRSDKTGREDGPTVLPEAERITLPPPQKADSAPVQRPPLAERQAQASQSAPTLVRLARYSALPSSSQLLLGSNDARASSQAPGKGLISVNQAVSRMGPAKTEGLLNWFLSFFRTADKSTAGSEDILNGLKNYHDSCRGGNVSSATEALTALSEIVNRQENQASHHPELAKLVREMRDQISSEQSTLESLRTQLDSGNRLPKGAGLSHALAFLREGVSLRDMGRLVDAGLELDQTHEAAELVAQEKLSAAHSRQPVGFRLILNELQSYHDTCDTPSAAAGGLPDLTTAKLAMLQLDELQGGTQRFLSAARDEKLTETLRDLHDQSSIERKVLQGVIDELESGGSLPEGAELSHALAFAREGVSLKDMARLMSKGLLRSQATEGRILLDSERATSVMNDLNNRPPEEKARITREFNEGELLLLQLSGLGRKGGDEYRRLGIPITRQTIVTERSDEHRLGDMSPLGSGAFNQVFGARYGGPEGMVNGVFKPLSNVENGWVAYQIGIDMDQPKVANRNLATQDVASALGFDVVVNCQIGTRQHPDSRPGDMRPQIGLVMGRAPGTEALRVSREHFNLPEVRREITKLQLLDHLVGQGDRHGGNYFIDVQKDASGQTKVKVSGIDNDQCFGKNTLHANDICYIEDDDERDGYRGTSMPELLDADMAAAIRRMTPEVLSELLSDKLSEQEVAAAQMRLATMHVHIDTLEASGRVISPSEWNQLSEHQVASYFNESNSYFARDAADANHAF